MYKSLKAVRISPYMISNLFNTEDSRAAWNNTLLHKLPSNNLDCCHLGLAAWEYFCGIHLYLKGKEYSPCAWQVVRVEIERCLSLIEFSSHMVQNGLLPKSDAAIEYSGFTALSRGYTFYIRVRRNQKISWLTSVSTSSTRGHRRVSRGRCSVVVTGSLLGHHASIPLASLAFTCRAAPSASAKMQRSKHVAVRCLKRSQNEPPALASPAQARHLRVVPGSLRFSAPLGSRREGRRKAGTEGGRPSSRATPPSAGFAAFSCSSCSGGGGGKRGGGR
ncbi:PREDICTED: uncharacterized protein LOC103087963 [Lipotes vexillifer]|uniref:Uncharacterized protein LOC103087963 n=1 Tax=Lipotes vexillifer TaxID=118797 RepID=A0A340Y5X2_LIPVE|nr:PREDICTED: uncharacterized protein LOC103087963 [Lipotes vexillifer]